MTPLLVGALAIKFEMERPVALVVAPFRVYVLSIGPMKDVLGVITRNVLDEANVFAVRLDCSLDVGLSHHPSAAVLPDGNGSIGAKPD